MLFFFFFLVAFAIGATTIALSTAQKMVGTVSQSSILRQKESIPWLKQSSFILFVFLETPFILLGIIIGYLFTIINSISNNVIPYFLIYPLGVISVAIITIISCGKFSISLLKGIESHSWKGSAIFNRLIITCSLLQTPLIIIILSVFMNSMQLEKLFLKPNFFPSIALLNIGSFCGISIGAIGVVKGIAEVISGFSELCVRLPSLIDSRSSSLFVSIGICEAAIVFPFIVNFLILSMKTNSQTMIIAMDNIIFVILILLGITVSVVSAISGKIIRKAFASFVSDDTQNTVIFSNGIISQILLDARILYVFIFFIVSAINLHLL